MKILLLLIFLFFIPIFAQGADEAVQENNTEAVSPKQKVLYLSYESVPERALKGEIFSITLKLLSTLNNANDVVYKLTNYQGLEVLTQTPSREQKSKYFFDTFYFLAKSNQLKLPDIEAFIADSNRYASASLSGSSLNAISLNPKNDFSNIIANSFELIDYRTTSYDSKHNIIVFVATAQNCDIGAMHFKNVFKQGIESIQKSHLDSRITYYVIINKEVKNFSFSYFNLQKNNFFNVNIPIIVDDDSVTTQSDLKPTDQSREMLKMQIAGAVAFFGLVLVLWIRKYIYLIFVLIPLIYIAILAIPSKEICINKGANIYLLPVSNGTIFETAKSEYRLNKEGSVNNFIKVELQNKQIGWVKNEDICSN
ncbi:MAG: hypothetical protein WC667_06545 [Sulfurimonas sp.]